MRVASLHIYPVKAMRGLAAEAADVERRGLAGDRRMMVVDEAGVFRQRSGVCHARVAHH